MTGSEKITWEKNGNSDTRTLRVKMKNALNIQK